MPANELEQLRGELRQLSERLEELEEALAGGKEKAVEIPQKPGGSPPWWLSEVKSFLEKHDLAAEASAVSVEELPAWLLHSGRVREQARRQYDPQDPYLNLKEELVRWGDSFIEGQVKDGLGKTISSGEPRFYLARK